MSPCCVQFWFQLNESQSAVRVRARFAAQSPSVKNLDKLSSVKEELDRQQLRWTQHRETCSADLSVKIPKGRAPKPPTMAVPKVDRRRKPKRMPSREELQQALTNALAPERLARRTMPPTSTRTERQAARAVSGDTRLVSPAGMCQVCAMPITGERRLCGPCAANR